MNIQSRSENIAPDVILSGLTDEFRRLLATGNIRRVLDTGADEHIRGKMYHPTRDIGTRIDFETVNGAASSQKVMDVNIPGGRDTAFYLESSVDADSLGKLVRKNNQTRSGTRIYRPGSGNPFRVI